MIDVIDGITDADVASPFTIQRNPGQFAAGGWQANAAQVIQAFGAVRNTKGRELDMVPAADRVHELATFRSTSPMYDTDAVKGITSDVLTWQGSQYRVVVVKQYQEQGYYLAIAARMSGE